MAARYWVGGSGTWDTTTTHWSTTDGGAAGATAPGTGDDVYFTSLSGSANYTVTRTATTAVLSITMNGPSSGTLTFAGTSAIGISTGNLTVGATGSVSWTNTGTLTKTGSGTITANSVTINSPITINGTGITVNLGSNITMGTTTTLTLTAGTLNLATYALTCGLFSSSGTTTRSITFGSNSTINLSSVATATIWNMATVTGFTTAGTPAVNITGAAASGITRTITLGSAAAQYVDFNITSGATGSTVSISSGNNITVSTGYTGAITNATGSIYKSLVLGANMSGWTSSVSILTFSGPSATINSAGKTIVCPVTITGTVTLQASLTIDSAQTVTVTDGTLNTNGFNFTCGTYTHNSGTLNTSAGTTFTNSVATNIGTAANYNPTINFINTTVNLAAVTFASGTINTTGSAITCSSTFNQSASSSATSCLLNVTDASAFTVTGLYTITGGTALATTAVLDTTNNTISVGSMKVSASTSRYTTLTFGTSGRINLTGNNTTIWDSSTVGSNFTINGTLDIRSTYTGSTGTRTLIASSTLTYYQFGIKISAGSGVVSAYGAFGSLDFTGFSGSIAPASGLTITSSLVIPATVTSVSSASSLTFNGDPMQFSTGGVTIDMPVTLTTGTLTMQSNLTVGSSRIVTIVAGTFNTNGFSFSCGTYNQTSGTLNTSGGIFTVSTAANFGTTSAYNPTINFINTTVNLAAVAFFSGSIITTGSTVTCTSTLNQSRNASATSCSLNVSDCTSFTVNGLYTFTGYSLSAGTGATLDLTNKTININSMSVGGTDNLTTFAFGTSGRINLTGNSTTIWSSSNARGLSITGTPDIRCTYAGATGTRAIIADITTTNYQIPIKITAGSDTVNIYGAFGDVDFTGFSGTITPASTLTITSSLNIPTSVVSVTSAQILEFNGTNTTLNTNGETINMPVTVTSGSFTQLSDLTVSSGRLVSLNSGTYNSNGFAFSCGTLNIGTATPYNPVVNFINSVIQCTVASAFYSGSVYTTGSSVSFNTMTQTRNSSATSCNLYMGDCLSFSISGLYTINGYSSTTGATLDLTNNILYAQSMTVGGTDDLTTLIFGTSGRIELTGNSATIWNSSAAGGLTMTGTPDIRCTYAGTTGTRAIIADFTTTNYQIPIKITSGSDTVNIYGAWKSVDFTGFGGTITPASTLTITSALTIPATVAAVTSAQILEFNGATTITTNGGTIDMPVTLTAGSLSLNDSLIMGTTRTFTLTAGTLTTNNNALTCGAFSSSNSNTRTINLGSSIVTLAGTGSVWSTSTTTGLTLNAGTSTIILSNNTTAARSFSGGSKTYYNLVIGGNTATSTTTFAGSNTFNNISSTKTVAHTVTFSAATTNTFANFSLSGSSGSIVTINSTSSTPHNLVKTGTGVVSCNYMTISYSAATPANTWYAGANSTQGTSVTGWIFTAAPGLSANTFFFGSAF